MTDDYRQLGLKTYGDSCEFCGNHMVEVHHISYQEHNEIEVEIRKAKRNKQDLTPLLNEARQMGYLEWDGYQLEKDNRSTNLAVLCGNCHTLMHKLDVGKNILKALTPRK